MPFYTGRPYVLGEVSIGPPDFARIDTDVADEFSSWFNAAPERDDMCYFSIYCKSAPVGAIFLHDIMPEAGESLIGYHIFDPQQRRQGIGTKALALLKRFVVEQTDLRRLIIITSRDNRASQGTARNSKFVHVGASREDPEKGMVFEWLVTRDSASLIPIQTL